MSSVLERLAQIARSKIESALDSLEARQEKRSQGKKNQSGQGGKFSERTDKLSKQFSIKEMEAFKALEVPVGSGFETCKKSYRDMANKYHPDKWQNSTEEKKRLAEEIFKRVGEAYKVVKNYYSIK